VDATAAGMGRVGTYPSFSSTFTIAAIALQLRVVARAPNSSSSEPRRPVLHLICCDSSFPLCFA
jgi:hypothetical protein